MFLTVSELGIPGNSITVPKIISVSVTITVALKTGSTILRSISRLITKKINKHSEIELLAKSKLNSIEEKFTNAIKDGKITDEEFYDIEQEIKNYENMKSNILKEYKEQQALIEVKGIKTDIIK